MEDERPRVGTSSVKPRRRSRLAPSRLEREGASVSQEATSPDLPAILTVDELATLLRVNRKTAYDAIAEGRIPGARRVGRVIRVSRDTVLQWIHGQMRDPRPPR